ncbi:TPA: cysteine--tRNA ligase [Candidatus Amesbacteria bacterium]|nr:MAG: Cysteine-tRNA ligase [Candidatus Amesbacteria bacterium GW2011_GWA1_44_24]KKU30649.1 MAG: Cysteine-tRNA ligase [Candidatus Amesbacteria bacterium GW2011_GWC1_46_24]HBC72443.1 cysteine--tRNA ligase [Candidatus Amesbacteria bacterium]
MRIYNSLSRQVEEFVPIRPPKVGMYTCGPTVYSMAHIGNFRTYTLGDLLLRVLRAGGYEVNYIMNITDVGHLTGDNLGDADTGEDRMEAAARRERKSAYDIARYYTQKFLTDFDKLNLQRPEVMPKATEHIAEQVELVQKLEKNGFAYKIDDGVYFDTAKFPRYGEMSNLEQILEGARVEINPQKRNARDFALWKFSPTEVSREMEWDSPWGKGFPGWHIECSAMSMKYLGESFDIHAGAEDLRSTHHPNEVAQSEAATRKQFVKYWVHGAFLLVDGGRMSKSQGNNYVLADLEEKGFSPMALRYLYLTAHYRSPLNFTWSSLAAAQSAWDKLDQFLKNKNERVALSKEKEKKLDGYRIRFVSAVNDDLQTPQALGVMWEMLKSNIPDYDKADTLKDWDSILGLKLGQAGEVVVPPEVRELADKRNELRRRGKFVEADEVRFEMEKMGWKVEDSALGPKIKKLIDHGL